jgi:hypothetical protein
MGAIAPHHEHKSGSQTAEDGHKGDNYQIRHANHYEPL